MPLLGGILSSDTVTEVESGAGAPGSAPAALGNLFVDTTNDNIYAAADNAAAGDWKLLNGTGSTGLTWNAATQTVEYDGGTNAQISWTLAQLNTSVSDDDVGGIAAANTWTGTNEFNGDLVIPSAASPTLATVAEVAWDETDEELHIRGAATTKIFIPTADTTLADLSLTEPSGWSTPANVTPKRDAWNANAISLDDIADSLGTLIGDLITAGYLTA